MLAFSRHFAIAAPLFVLVLLGYGLVRWGRWPQAVADALTRFVFSIALPALLFRLMNGFADRPAVDARLLFAFFGSCFIVFVVGRLVARGVFGLDGTSQSVFALGGVFSNNVLLGLPLAHAALGAAALPVVALVLVFNSLLLWTLVTVSVEWSRQGAFSAAGFGRTASGVLRNPIVAAILAGTAIGITGVRLPPLLTHPLDLIGTAAMPLSLIALGMSLAQYGLRADWQQSAAIVTIKLVLQPLVVWALALALRLPPLETRVVVLLASLAVGANVYLMSKQFRALEGPASSSIVLSTLLAAVTTPLFLALTGP